MPVIWNLKKWLAVNHDIYRPIDLQKLIEEKAGVKLSLQAISTLINNEPSSIRCKTIQALCNALNCKISDFFDIVPDSPQEQQKWLKEVGSEPVQLYGGKQNSQSKENSIFPNPHKYINDSDEKKSIS